MFVEDRTINAHLIEGEELKSKGKSKSLIITITLILISILVGLFIIKSNVFFSKGSSYSIDKANALFENNQINAAYSHISKLIIEDSTNVQAYLFRVKIHEESRRYENALEDLKVAERLSSKDAFIYERYGVIYAKMNRLDESIQYLNKAISIDASNTNIYNNRGISYSLMKRHDSALLDFNMALKIEENNHQARLNRANLYYTLSEYEKSKSDLELLKKFQDNNFPINFKLGLIELKSGNQTAGLEIIRPFATTTNRAAQIAENLVEEKLFEESLEFYKIAIGDEGLREKMFFQRADVYNQLGDYQNAIDDLLVIVETMPKAIVFFKIGVLYLKLDQLDKACEFWNEAKIRDHKKSQELIEEYCFKS